MSSDYVVYATGFKGRRVELRDFGGNVLECGYTPATGEIAPGVWGFGLAYPSMYEKPQGGTAPDIGLPGFVEHIQTCLGAILNS
jgi:hypothetical protein